MLDSWSSAWSFLVTLHLPRQLPLPFMLTWSCREHRLSQQWLAACLIPVTEAPHPSSLRTFLDEWFLEQYRPSRSRPQQSAGHPGWYHLSLDPLHCPSGQHPAPLRLPRKAGKEVGSVHHLVFPPILPYSPALVTGRAEVKWACVGPGGTAQFHKHEVL